VDPAAKQLRRLFDERPHRVPAALVSGRDDLDYRNDTAEPVLDRDPVCLPGIDIGLG
jgi:hypothetical protein